MRNRRANRLDTLLSIELSARYGSKPDVLREVAFSIDRGEILGLVGPSGCGKSTLSLAILRLLHLKRGEARGSIAFQGRDLMQLREREMRALRGKQIGLVLQSPLASLNPALRIGTQLEEAWRAHVRGPRAGCQAAIRQMLDTVSLPSDEEFLRRYPSQMSVGQAQRVLIGMAVLHRPALLLADEPTSALDPVTQSEILKLFADLSRRLDMSILYISHDLLSVAAISHRVAVLSAGQIVECAETAQVFRNPQHPYTRALVESIPLQALNELAGRPAARGAASGQSL
jgi:ABC-type dipeptide/oligopeptide/nickel transport system ATPase component